MDLDKELDKVKAQVFLSNNAAFLGSVLASLTFVWDTKTVRAATDGINLFWNPDWFKITSMNVRKATLMHEIWHVARLHMVRKGSRQIHEWVQACDYRINNDLHTMGYDFENESHLFDPSLDVNGLMAEEDIYDLIIQGKLKPPPTEFDGDVMACANAQTTTNNVVRAVQQAKLGTKAGNVPAGIEDMLTKFLTPIIPWEKELMEFFTAMMSEDYTWARPNRRYTEMYLPSVAPDEGTLEHLEYYVDVSSSITPKDILRFTSEVKYIQEVINPQRLTIIQFNTVITNVREFAVDEPFENIKIVGRGGTSLKDVRERINKTRPTAVIVFSDLECVEMEPLDPGVQTKIIWVVVNNKDATVPYGRMLHIKH